MSALTNVDADIVSFLRARDIDVNVLPSGKLHCALTSTDIAPTLSAVESYFGGRAYKRALAQKHDQVDLSAYPNIIAHRTKANAVYCRVTKMTLNARRSEIEAHIRGRRYVHALALRERRRALEQEAPAGSAAETADVDDVWQRLPTEVVADAMDDDDDDDDDDNEDDSGGVVSLSVVDDSDGVAILKKQFVPRRIAAALHDDDEDSDGADAADMDIDRQDDTVADDDSARINGDGGSNGALSSSASRRGRPLIKRARKSATAEAQTANAMSSTALRGVEVDVAASMQSNSKSSRSKRKAMALT